MGYGDLGCFGQETLNTPHIDQLAADGMKLTRHYSGSTVCAPSRCVLMTGLHTGHCTVRGNGDKLLKPTDITIAQKLKEAGYRTGCFGKWGIGHPPPRDNPNQFGFDEFYGYVNMHHAHNFFPEFLIRNGEMEKLDNVLDDMWREKKGYELGGPREGAGVAKVKKDYAPNLITDEAIRFIETGGEEPFFLYFALNMPHTNNEGGRDPYKNGMEVPDYGEYADKDWPDTEKGFAQMMRMIDGYVGRVVETLEKKGLTEETIILFSSDNGPHEEGGHVMEYFDSNGPLRGMKRDLYEGGVRVPTIVKWPGKVAAGTESDVLSGFQDVFPTLTEVAGADTPENLDGISLVPVLTGDPDKQSRHDFLYWEFQEQGGKKAITDGKWKFIMLGTQKASYTPSELYDLSQDPGEEYNLAPDNGELADRLREKMEEFHTPED
ncbi:MAG: N-acetylgalactosamine-6-sulfatase [Verrucomicrobiales bacterium]|nr:N-acetylgalactosamine-6-sulfatase [Verrucomicrobiales bacterium]